VWCWQGGGGWSPLLTAPAIQQHSAKMSTLRDKIAAARAARNSRSSALGLSATPTDRPASAQVRAGLLQRSRPPTTPRHTSLTCCGGGHMHLFIFTSDACLTVPSLSHSLFARAHVYARGTEIFKQNNSSRLLLVKESSSTHSPTWPRLPH
jgi:hypothetical protein